MDKQSESFKGTEVPKYCPPRFMALTVRGDAGALALIDVRHVAGAIEHEGGAVVLLQGEGEGVFVRESIEQVMKAWTRAAR